MPPPATNFRKAVAAHMATATEIGDVVHGERTGLATEGSDLIAVWTQAGAANEANQQFRVYQCTARVMYARDAQRTPDEDDPLDELEQLEADIVAGIPPILGGARVVSVDSQFYGADGAIDFVFVGEFNNCTAEV